MFMKLFFLVCIFSVSQGVFAAGKLTIEPYLGVGTFKQSETFSTTLGTDFDASFDDSGTGIALGARGGLLFGKTYWALDYHLGGPYEMELAKREYTNTLFGGGVGYFGNQYRAWIGYYGHAVVEDSNNSVKYQGIGIKIVAGFQFQSKLILNIEYLLQDIKEKKFDTQDIPLGDISISVLYFTVSSPISF